MRFHIRRAVIAGLLVTLFTIPVEAAGKKGSNRARKKTGQQKPDAARKFQRLDRDDDGQLSLTEFTSQRDGKRSEQLFKRLDRDQDGQLNPAELRDGRGRRKS